jgi:hypothetical protein
MKAILGPDFFIVGAPKCGTTSLNTYLAEHPSVFMAKKEQHFFGSDLAQSWPQPTAERYFASFAGSEWAKRRGEASGWYLWSRRAAKEICAYNSSAQIIAMLRNPVDMLPSLHSQYLHDEIEDLKDFGEALAAEDDRRCGRRIPPLNGSYPWRLFYQDVIRFHEQLERYYAVFGRDQVHVILFDDLVGDPATTYRRVLEFLGIDATFVPTFRVMNPNKRTRSRLVKRMVGKVMDPSSRIRRTGVRLIPVHTVRSAMLRDFVPAATRLNTSLAPRSVVDPDLRESLAAELAPDIERLGEILGRDLSHWYSSSSDAPRSTLKRHPVNLRTSA